MEADISDFSYSNHVKTLNFIVSFYGQRSPAWKQQKHYEETNTFDHQLSRNS